MLTKFLSNIIFDNYFEEYNYGAYVYDAYDDVNVYKTRLNLIDNGYCINVAEFVSECKNEIANGNNIQYILVDIKGSDAYHVCMFLNGKYYDAYNYRGVKNIDDLKFVQIYNKNGNYQVVAYLLSIGNFNENMIPKIKTDEQMETFVKKLKKL